jgi:hypothetical protein
VSQRAEAARHGGLAEEDLAVEDGAVPAKGRSERARSAQRHDAPSVVSDERTPGPPAVLAHLAAGVEPPGRGGVVHRAQRREAAEILQ